MLKHDSPEHEGWHFGMRLRVLVPAASTGKRLAICQVHAPPGSRTAVHRHEGEDEVVHVLAGVVEVWQQGATTAVRAGESLLLPKGVPHRLSSADGASADFLCAFLPGGVERSLLAASAGDVATSIDPDDVAALLSGAGVSVYGWQVEAPADRRAEPEPEPV